MDLAAMNEDGYIFLKGRADDIINCDGIKFYPIEVENALLLHPDVTAAAVFGWPHPKHGEVAVAVVTTGAPASEEDFVAFCKRQLAPFKAPRVVMVVPEMPRNPMGKILKGKLKADLARELANRT
jgi:fatty-acyl-CoA synthase